jgi:hypothetical protein
MWSIALVGAPPRRLFCCVVFKECDMPEGKVKKVVAEKGFGFIEGPSVRMFSFTTQASPDKGSTTWLKGNA